MDAASLEALIRAGVPEATVEVQDLRGDGQHYTALVVSPAFEGKSRLEQHRMVFRALGPHLGDALHALQLTTRTGKGAA